MPTRFECFADGRLHVRDGENLADFCGEDPVGQEFLDSSKKEEHG